MGVTVHDATVVVVQGHRTDLAAARQAVGRWRSKLAPAWRALIVGPVMTPVNYFEMYVMLPDGSHEGAAYSVQGDELREEFVALFAGRKAEIVGVAFGHDLTGRLEPWTVTDLAGWSPWVDDDDDGDAPGTAAAVSLRPSI